MHRFYLPDWSQWRLAGDEAHHALHVRRLRAGEIVTVFDGRGHEAQCRVASLAGGAVGLERLAELASAPLRCRLTLAQAIPKRGMDLILQKATELGVTAIVPLISERTVVQAAGEGSNRLARWRSIVLEACKQCGNNWLPAVAAPVNAREFLAGLAPVVEDRELRLIGSLQPDARPLKAILAERPRTGDAAPAALVVIGPEGDFTPAELIDARAAGCRPLSLGPLVLRSDTAAFYALSILHHELQG